MKETSYITFNYRDRPLKDVRSIMNRCRFLHDDYDLTEWLTYVDLRVHAGDERRLLLVEELTRAKISFDVRRDISFSPADLKECDWVHVTPNRALLSSAGYNAQVKYDRTGCPACRAGSLQMGSLTLSKDIEEKKAGLIVILDACFVLVHDSIVKYVRETTGTDSWFRRAQKSSGEAMPWWQIVPHMVFPPLDVRRSKLLVDRKCRTCNQSGFAFTTSFNGYGLSYNTEASLVSSEHCFAYTWECFGNYLIDQEKCEHVPCGRVLISRKIASVLWKRKVGGFKCEPVIIQGKPPRLADLAD